MEARTRLSVEGPNSLPTERTIGFFRIAWRVIREPMILLLVAAGVISFLIASALDAVLLFITVLIVLVISIFQEGRTERALQALKDLSSPLAFVLRDGIEDRIPSREVVSGDLIILQEGDRVPADAKVISGTNLLCDESLLTGESLSIDKLVGDNVFSGTLIVRGHGRALVTGTGVRTEIGKIGKSLQEIPFARTRLQADVQRLVQVIGVLGFFTVAAVILIFGLTRHDWLEGALAGIASAMALIPEEFPVILTLFLAIGARRMSRVRVIARKAAAIEALGSVSVLCVDKTGTLTMNQMTISEVHCDGQLVKVGGSETPTNFIKLARTGTLAGPKNPIDPMDKAFHALWEISSEDGLESIEEFPVESERLAYVHIWRQHGKVFAAAKGAPETISQLCKLNHSEHEQIQSDTSEAGNRGFRVLAIAHGELQGDVSAPIDLKNIRFNYLGLALLHDPVRPGVVEAIRECTNAGIRTIMITGDHPTTALSIAREIGIGDGEHCITGDQISAMSDSDLATSLRTISVFARVAPEHKLKLVRALRLDGYVVGMTGDGVNDAPALRAADIGIAMGGRGTDVAREASSLIITDDNFTSIVEGVKKGRGIFANLQKSISYVVAVHIPIFGMSIIPILNRDWPLILLPALVAFHEVIIDPACSIVFEEEPPDPEIMTKPPRPIDSRLVGPREILLPSLLGFSVLIAVVGVFRYGITHSFTDGEVRSLCFSTLIFANLFLILCNRSRTLTIVETLRNRRNRALPWILVAGFALAISLTSIQSLGQLFSLSPISFFTYPATLALAYVSISWHDLLKIVRRQRLSRT